MLHRFWGHKARDGLGAAAFGNPRVGAKHDNRAGDAMRPGKNDRAVRVVAFFEAPG